MDRNELANKPFDKQLLRVSRRQLFAGALLGPAAWLLSADAEGAEAAPLTRNEARALTQNGSVERRLELAINQRPYLAALSYCSIPQPAAEVFSMLTQPNRLKKALPVTRDVQFSKDEAHLRVVQGTFLVNGGYTLDWRPDASQGLIQFWMDPSQPHDLDDLLGYFRVQEHNPGSCLLTVAVAIDLGKNSVATLFKGKIHDYLGRPARYIARYMRNHPIQATAMR